MLVVNEEETANLAVKRKAHNVIVYSHIVDYDISICPSC